MIVKYFTSGFLVKMITGLDDTLVHVPILANTTKTRIGKIAFGLGVLLAVCLAVTIAFLFASSIKRIPNYKYIAASLVFLLAVFISLDLFVRKPQKKFEEKSKKKIKPLKIKKISRKRFFKLLALGFVAAFVTVIDDTIAYSPLFLKSISVVPFVIAGILTATVLELAAIIYFTEKIRKIPYKKQISILGLALLGILILFEII